ncbi:MAG: hypothetical protein RLN86_01445 [Cyclobacteriaceae bacterium]
MKQFISRVSPVIGLLLLFSCIEDELGGLTVDTRDVTISYSCKGNCTHDITYYQADFNDLSKRTEAHSKGSSSSSSGTSTSAGKGTFAYANGEVAKITVTSDDDDAEATIEFPEGTIVKEGKGKNISLTFTVKF